MHNFIVFDFETGGLDYKVNPITQVAFVVLDGSSLKELETYSAYVYPYKSESAYEIKALNYTNTTMDSLYKKGVPVADVYKKCVELFRKYKQPGRAGNSKYYPMCVGHNASDFDRKFLWQLFKDHGDDVYSYIQAHITDTMKDAQNAVPTLSSVTLTNCCEHFGITLEGAHDALNDTRATAELFRLLTFRLRQESSSTASEQAQYIREFKFQW